MNMMANAGPYGGPYGQSAGQGMPGAGLGPQLQNKATVPNNIANQFNMDKKTAPGQSLQGMVRRKVCSRNCIRFTICTTVAQLFDLKWQSSIFNHEKQKKATIFTQICNWNEYQTYKYWTEQRSS